MKCNLIFKFAVPLFAAVLLASCEKSPVTIVMHSPIYPASGEDVTYTAEKVTTGDINSAKLYETVSTIDATGAIVSAGTETQINSWTSPAGNLSFTKTGGYAANRLVTYRFEITTPDGTKNFMVTYAIRPYPVADMPAPVYAQGDPDDVFDIVFIPDTDIASITNFYNNCRGAIRDAYFSEQTLRVWRRQFNFYINTQTGHATDYDRISIDGLHQTPTNYANLSFAEGKVLMHQNNLRDYSTGSLFSTEMQNRGTLLHEAGHGLFGLADEYNGGVHWQAADFPNNWSSLANANSASKKYGSCKDSTDVKQMGTTGWYKLCDENCQMKISGLNISFYDCPCQQRINYVVLDNAIN